MIEIIDRVVDREVLEKSVKRFREKGIILPTFEQLKNPGLIPAKIKKKLKDIGLWDLHPLNLFRITWKNEPKEKGGLYGGVNYMELPQALTGVDARVVALIGKYFPTGAHKVGAAYGCLAPRIITGQFDPTYHKAVWPSTGNGCTAVAILPEEMSKERFTWLEDIGAEVIATPGCESNVKEIYDKCWEIRKTRPDCIILNQFDEFGNSAWHYTVTGSAIEEVYNKVKDKKSNLAAYVSATGSAGTIGAGDYLRTLFPVIKVVASEALQCPTLLYNGFGAHRIEGIGDKHVPWIHNVKNTNLVTATDDEDCMRLFRLFNEEKGKEYLKSIGIEAASEDIIFTIFTDSADMYRSRIGELREERGEYTSLQAVKDMEKCLYGITVDHTRELTYMDQKTVHNLKYFTWREQQEKEVEDLDQLWYDRGIWQKIFQQPVRWDELINEFNKMTGLLKQL
jgi:cysteine synthase